MYRRLFGRPDRAIVSSFFSATARRAGVTIAGAVIRPEVRRVAPTVGDYLLAYVSKGHAEFTPALRKALAGCRWPVRVYGTGEQGQQGNLQFKPVDNLAFINDLAGCRAVLTTTGNQLLGEALYYGKRVLGMPIDCLEQRLNERQLETLGFGRRIDPRRVTAGEIRGFLESIEHTGAGRVGEVGDGAAEAIAAIDRCVGELVWPSPEGSPP